MSILEADADTDADAYLFDEGDDVKLLRKFLDNCPPADKNADENADGPCTNFWSKVQVGNMLFSCT